MPEYQISAPALHAARTLLRHYTIKEKPTSDIEATTDNLARLIDHFTHAWRVRQQIRELTQRVNWLPSGDLEDRMEELKESVLALDTLRRDIPRYEDDPEPVISLREQRNGHQKQEQARKRAKAYHVSAAAVNAIRQIQEHFVFEEAPYGQMDFNEVNAAGIVDVCTNVYRVQDALNRMCAIVRHLNPHEMQRNMEMVRAALKALDIAVMRMPGFQPPTTRLRKVKEGPGLVAELSHEQKRNRQQVSLALSRARTPEEAQQVLNNARSDNLL